MRTFDGCRRGDQWKKEESYAFFSNRQLRQIELPESLERIESSAFTFCENLKRVRIPKSIDYVDEHAFHSRTKLIGFKKQRKPHILSPLTRLWLSISGWGEAVFYLIGFFVDSTFKRMQCRMKHEPVPSYRSLLVHRGFGGPPEDEDDDEWYMVGCQSVSCMKKSGRASQ